MSGSTETSCSISPIGKIGVRSSGPSGCLVPGLSGGDGVPGRSGSRFTQCVGMSLSGRRYFTGWPTVPRFYAHRDGRPHRLRIDPIEEAEMESRTTARLSQRAKDILDKKTFAHRSALMPDG